ncbi:MAG TPA: glycosyltransferase [Telluria sp.]|nr:glycosyltransferase [Telluria sp.]
MNRPPLSIIVPAYNAERYIAQCIASILLQVEAHHALIVINDGSTDGTLALAEQLRRDHPGADFSIVSQANKGIAEARNRGLAEALGDYILFIDSDDVLLPGSLAALDGAIGACQPDVIACNFNMWCPDKGDKRRPVTLGYPANVPIEDREAILSTFFADRHMYVWANVVRRAIYSRLPAPVFPVNRAFEDVSVLSRVLVECERLYHLPHMIIDYRQHPASITKVISEKWCMDFAAALMSVKRHFTEHPTSDAVKMQIDVTACYFYIGIVKNSYQLGWAEGRKVRERVKDLFIASLFNQPDTVLAAMEDGTVVSHDRAQDVAIARQVSRALAGSLRFDLAKAFSRTIKLRRRLRASGG